ncbi:MAG: hypothetical protein U9Q78_05700 [Chloroflexota bacterium]|nr:hypothetical protein [Chloroflexota bacterium]
MNIGTSIGLAVPSAFVYSLLVALLLYWIGGKISVKGKVTSGKLTSYACGEDLPADKLEVNERGFFIFWVYFLIFDILAFILATSLSHPGLIPALYAAISLLAILMLFPLRSMS